ncbi:MAG: putative Fe-S cluster biosis protein NfuA, 4Fe-4S-binding domain [Gammaproteobacteria bacterium]|jgi:hypothetical protein|nr:putative Fe-S cluster biosis protein NfuA, 4Fe-4S-binding domain [Gammaproteobacteria bacterium]
MSDVRPIEQPVSIRAEVSLADPDTCKFTVSRAVHPGGPFFFENREQAAGSPLVERLFQLPGVAHVLVAGNVVTVGKENHTAWSGLKASIGTVIRSHLLTDLVSPSARVDRCTRAAGGSARRRCLTESGGHGLP